MISTILFVIAVLLYLPQILIYLVYLFADENKSRGVDTRMMKDMSYPSAMLFLAAVVAKFIGLP